MKKRKLAPVLVALLLVTSCGPKPADSPQAPAGKWSGDYGPVPDGRQNVEMELRWEGSDLKGTVQAGNRSLQLTKALYTPASQAITLEFDAEGNGGRTVHYVIDGKVEGDTMKGTWIHDDQNGDFHVTKAP